MTQDIHEKLNPRFLWEKQQTLFTRKFGIRDVTSKVVHSEQNFDRCLKFNTLEGISEISGKYGYVVLEKDGEDHMV
jgi:hypothetical protein